MRKNNAIGNVIETIMKNHGINAFFDSRLVIAVFSDLAPNMHKERNLLQIFLECNGAQIVADINKPLSEQHRLMETLVKRMHEDHWLPLDAAQYICSEFYMGITGHEWKFQQSIATPFEPYTDLDVYRGVTIKSSDMKTQMSISVDTGGNKVYVPIPARISNGQTICFPKKGKIDPPSGKAGDLYVTFNVEKNAPVLLIIAIIVSLAVLVYFSTTIYRLQNSKPEEPSASQPVVESTTDSQLSTHVHVWAPATFTTAKACTICGLTQGSPIDYQSISVESEVLSIREKYKAIVANKDADNYRIETLRNGVDAYYSSEGDLACVVVHRGTDGIGEYSETYSRSYYFADGELFFAFYEGPDSHRLYFYAEQLMRWRYTENGEEAVNHDFDFSEEYYLWEKLALNEITTFIRQC